MKIKYNLATPELISKLHLVGAKADDVRKSDGNLQYRVRVKAQYVEVINELLSGSKLRKHVSGWYCITQKDIWHALQNSDVRRTSYGHAAEVATHCGLPVNSFTFSDGSVIRKCAFTHCTHFDVSRQRVLRAPLGQGAN